MACAGNLPKTLQQDEPDAPSAKTAQAEPDAHVGKAVRWGGEILSVRNLASSTDVELYARPLFNNAEPKPEGGEGVRFIARFSGFVDPAEYAPGKRLTVHGRLRGAETAKVGEFAYLYPVVEVGEHRLWEKFQPVPEPIWFRDPYYDPWWPWGPWGPFHHRHHRW
jgi:outer membrane lipoprotein